MQKIQFNDDYSLTQAVKEGRKNMTRRIEAYNEPSFKGYTEDDGLKPFISDNRICIRDDDGYLVFNKPTRYKVGEIVAVAQRYKDAGVRFVPDDEIGEFPADQTAGWTNKMFVRADLMPIRIRITDIDIERLQDISEEDCMREGVFEDGSEAGIFYDYDGNKGDGFNTPREAFASLIDKVSGKGTWEHNPFVVVYSFELVK